MVEKIEAYQTKDGQTFPSLEQAEEHEKNITLRENIICLFNEEYKGEKISNNAKIGFIDFIINNIEEIRSL